MGTFRSVRLDERAWRFGGRKDAKHNACTRAAANTRLEVELRDGSVGIAKWPCDSQYEGAVDGARKLYTQRTCTRIAFNAVSTAPSTSITSAAVATRTNDA
jgi:hypothetical protein